EELADALGVNLSKRTAEQIVADASVDFESFYRERSLRLAPDSGPLLIASVDGKGVPMVKSAGGERKVRLARGEKRNKKRMSTVGAVFTQKPNIRTPEAVVESLFAESSKPDRKSTRLNSSHLVRSYAVFCLKKKAGPSGAGRALVGPRRRPPGRRRCRCVRCARCRCTARYDDPCSGCASGRRRGTGSSCPRARGCGSPL